MSPTRKKFLFIALPLVIIFIAIALYLTLGKQSTVKQSGANSTNSNQESGQSNTTNNSSFASQYGQNCDKTAEPIFSQSPLAMAKIGYIEPLGKTSDGHVTPVDHVYVAPIDSTVADNTYDVVMPADGRVIQIDRMPAQYIGDQSGVKLAQDDFRLIVSFSCRYYSIFIHVHKLSDALAKELPIEAGQNKEVKIDLKAGDVLAHLGGSAFDWTMVDTQTSLAGFVSPKLYQGESWKINTISPFDVYSGETKTALENKSLRTLAPLGGKIDYDLAGRLIGNWFKEGTNGYTGASQDRYWDGHLSIAPDYLDPTGVIYSTGNWQDKAGQYTVIGSFKPEMISASSGQIKIELTNRSYTFADGSPFTGGAFKKGMKLKTDGQPVGTVLLEVMAGEKLKLEQFPGKTASQVSDFTASATTYER